MEFCIDASIQSTDRSYEACFIGSVTTLFHLEYNMTQHTMVICVKLHILFILMVTTIITTHSTSHIKVIETYPSQIRPITAHISATLFYPNILNS